MKRITIAVAIVCLLAFEAWAGVIIQREAASGPGTVSFGAAGAASTSSSTTLTLTYPSGITSTSYVVVFICSDASPGTATATGWSHVDDGSGTLSPVQAVSASAFLAVLEKDSVSGSESGTVNFTMPSGNHGGFIMRFEKTSGTWAVEDADDFAFTTAGSSVTVPDTAVVASQNNSMFLLFYSNDDYNDGVTYLSTEPADMTRVERTQYSSAEGYAWYEAVSSGSQSDSVTVTGSTQNAILGIILEAQ